MSRNPEEHEAPFELHEEGWSISCPGP